MDMNPAKAGTKALAAHDGEVVKADSSYSGPKADPQGRYVIIKTTGGGDTVYYAYEHLDSISVKEGDQVVGGKTPVGVIGLTGRLSAGPAGHLHMVVAKTATLGGYSSSPQKNTLDPMDYLPKPAPYGYKCTK
jgi:murein DD-endopeptidase MepM/ murein hydrolase activator NlpD